MKKEANCLNIYIGKKTEINDLDEMIHVNFTKMGLFEKIEPTEENNKSHYIIYKDLIENKYIYVRSNGKVYTPSGDIPYPASHYLKDISDLMNLRMINLKAIRFIKLMTDSHPLDARTRRKLKDCCDMEQRMSDAEVYNEKKGITTDELKRKFYSYVKLYRLVYEDPLKESDMSITDINNYSRRVTTVFTDPSSSIKNH